MAVCINQGLAMAGAMAKGVAVRVAGVAPAGVFAAGATMLQVLVVAATRPWRATTETTGSRTAITLVLLDAIAELVM